MTQSKTRNQQSEAKHQEEKFPGGITMETKEPQVSNTEKGSTAQKEPQTKLNQALWLQLKPLFIIPYNACLYFKFFSQDGARLCKHPWPARLGIPTQNHYFITKLISSYIRLPQLG